MKPKNDILFRSRISERKCREIIKYFAIDLTAEQTAKLAHLNKKTVNRYYGLLREKIAKYCESVSMFKGEVELDESYFGGRKKGDKRGRGVTNKIPVFGIKRRDGKVCAQIIKNASKASIKPIIERLVNKKRLPYALISGRLTTGLFWMGTNIIG